MLKHLKLLSPRFSSGLVSLLKADSYEEAVIRL